LKKCEELDKEISETLRKAEEKNKLKQLELQKNLQNMADLHAKFKTTMLNNDNIF
jgi:hypothetical protein